MSNLPAPIDPNLLPAYHEGARAAYSQDLFLVEASLTLLAVSDDEFEESPEELERLRLRLNPVR